MLTIDADWTRPRPSARQQRNDAVLAVLFIALGIVYVELLRSITGQDTGGWRGVGGHLLSIGCVAPLAFRRRFPIAVLTIVAVCFVLLGEQSPAYMASVTVQVGLFIAFYTAWAWSRDRQRLALVSGAIIVGIFVWTGAFLVRNQDPSFGPAESTGWFSAGFALVATTIIQNVGYFFGAIAWGIVSWRAARQREKLHGQAHALRMQAGELRRQHQASARRAVAEERVRIARDLHDVVAHHISAVGVQAAGARRMLDRDVGQSRRALAAIELSSRDAVQEMHRLVTVLRTEDPDEDRSPQPGVADLKPLVEGSSHAQLTVSYSEIGHPHEISGTLSVSLYRTAQEALSNVRRHSTARSARVTLRWLKDPVAIELEIVDDGHPRSDTSDSDGGGFGLHGIRERAALHDGEHEIGSRPEGGFRVRVRMPSGPTTPGAAAQSSSQRPVSIRRGGD